MKRSEVAEKYKWDLSPIFKNDAEWEQTFDQVKRDIPAIEKYRGRLHDPHDLYDMLMSGQRTAKAMDRLGLYVYNKSSEDTSLTKYQAMEQRLQSLAVDYGTRSAYIEPELLKMTDARIDAIIASFPKLKEFKRSIHLMTRLREHILSESEELILTRSIKLAAAPGDIHNLLDNADLKFGKVKDENGRLTDLNQSSFVRMQRSKKRNVRKTAYKQYYGVYQAHRLTEGALRNASVDQYIFYTRACKYKNSIERALYPKEIDAKVYDNLLDSVHEALPLMHRLTKLKKRVLGVDALQPYDLLVPLAPMPTKKYTFEKAVKMVMDGLIPMGADYIKQGRALARYWDVMPSENKRGGGYSTSAYDTPSYILMNFEGQLDDVFTLAHELGHSMHSHYSKRQPYQYSDYTIFCAEIASTTNEQLLLNSRLKEADEATRLFLLDHMMEEFRTTLFRQAKFAEFERITHEMVERNEPLNADNLDTVYGGLMKKYYGPTLNIDREISGEWARIPHFFTNFYVYQYATGIIAALAISKDVLENNGAQRYIDNFLSAGSSKPPLDILKSVGVDLTTKKPMKDAMAVIDRNLKELEKLI